MGKYYEINEQAAKMAHEMMSMRDYVEGSKTAEYRGMVDKAYALAAEAAEAKPDKAEKVWGLADLYARKLADNMNRDSAIGMRCPSILVAGGGNFPVRKKEKQVAAWEKNSKEWQEIQGILEKIRNIKYGRDTILSGDDDALEKLEQKLADLKAMQERMKAANRAIRMKDKGKGDAKLREMGYTDKQIARLREPDYCGRVGYPDYALANNNANIHRVEGRIKDLRVEKESGTKETENEWFRAVENTETMRLQLFFEGKPDVEVRGVLKSNGFRWAPSQGAWQRQLTGNARYSLGLVTKALQEMRDAV